MMEGMTQQGQEEYIWAMRASAFRETDDDSWKSRFVTRTSVNIENASKIFKSTSVVDQQTKVLASLVPDEVIEKVTDYSQRHYEGAILFGDVSGFTDLCERYTKTGVSAPSRITNVLNKYLGSMVQEVMSHRGDVLKFSGDAFIAMFKVTDSDTMRDVVQAALNCAILIQKSYGSFQTDVGVVVRVKLALSCGLNTFAVIGDELNSHYVVVGKPVWDVKAAESISSAGDIIVAPAAWHYINSNEYIFEEMSDRIHYKVIGTSPNWRNIVKTSKNQKNDQDKTNFDEYEDDRSENDSIIGFDIDEFALRPAVNQAVRMKIKEYLRRYIIAPVMKCIDNEEPLEYLTEMRQSVTVFINVVSEKLNSDDKTCIFADNIYKIVCSIVNKMNGCVNKLSLFDKDLMLVVIFGLRGFKHELECQVALRCATQIHEAIRQISEVTSTSIGVTTGKTYCGIFGHTLRREYTVISLTCNKAARLMVAYNNKVTCDRETFLHSKLESRHFVLQAFKPLKGISHAGPVYEFKEVDVNLNGMHEISSWPLLGRQRECNIYRNLVSDWLNNPKTSTQPTKILFIKGDARQGKTRLLEELIFITPNYIPVIRVHLQEKNFKQPYSTIQLIFDAPLQLKANSTSEEKEQRLVMLLKTIQVPRQDMLCVLNPLFGVDFEKSKIYLSLDNDSRERALRDMIKQICQLSFKENWIIAIDNFEYADSKSWNLFDVFLEVGNIFVVSTMGREKIDIKVYDHRLLKDKRIKSVELNPIEKWYLGALACQVLNVYAISPEVENAIQIKSNGNPGWIESFLTALLQDGGLQILQLSLREVNEAGLVCPPLYMMKRLDKEEQQKWRHIMEERRPSVDSFDCQDNWKRYVDSSRDSYLNITIREQIETSIQNGIVTVCIISQNFHIGDEETELSMESMVLKTFDSLNFFERLLVKCSAILGNEFLRTMLFYVMAASNQRKCALAVQKLFEIRVLGCAKGDFLEGPNVYKERLTYPDEKHPICKCRGIIPHETCNDLPKYASCGFLQFKSPLFQEITYNLLTENQKKEFHLRAIRFLEKETHRCKACGYGFFEQILVSRRAQDKELIEKKDRKFKKDTTAITDSVSAGSWSDIRKDSTYSLSNKSDAATKDKKLSKGEDKSIVSITSGVAIESKDATSSKFGLKMIKQLKDNYTLTRQFSCEDFADCHCHLILSTTLAQLIVHCHGAEDYLKEIEAHIEYSYNCLSLHNLPLALETLKEGLQLVDLIVDKSEENLWQLLLIRAKMYCLLGCVHMELGELNEAMIHFHNALSLYGITLPNGFNRKLKRFRLLTKRFFGLYGNKKCIMKHLDYWEIIFYNNLSECLSNFCSLYLMLNKWKDAEFVGLWALVKSIESFSDFRIILQACTNMILISQHNCNWNICIALEVHSLNFCHLKKSRIERDDLYIVAQLYVAIFMSRIYRSDVDKAIQIGYVSLRICSTLHAVTTILPLLPLLIHSLLIGKHFGNCSGVLQDLDIFCEEDADHSGKVWYYALCMTVQLETGYSIYSYNSCAEYYQAQGQNWTTIRDPDSRKRFYTVMWLWCVRNEKWDAATVWCLKSNDFTVVTENDSLANKFTALYLLEGMILFLVTKLDKRNIRAVVEAENEIQILIQALQKAAKTSKIILPRLMHLKTYFKTVKTKDNDAIKLLKNARKTAIKCKNELELSWIDHSSKVQFFVTELWQTAEIYLQTLQAWTHSLVGIYYDFWKEHAEHDHLVDFHDLEMGEGKLGLFTLPLPLYI